MKIINSFLCHAACAMCAAISPDSIAKDTVLWPSSQTVMRAQPDSTIQTLPDGSIGVTTGVKFSWPGVRMDFVNGETDLSAYGRTTISVSNTTDYTTTVHLSVKGRTTQGQTPGGSIRLMPHSAGEIMVNLSNMPWALDAPLELNGMRGHPTDTSGTTFDLRRTISFHIFLCQDGAPGGFSVKRVTASGKVVIRSLKSIPVTSISRCLERGSLSTGVADVNKLISNIRWGQYSNYLSVPTDCPQRNERLGWAADTQVFSTAASYNADVYGFLCKWMHDMRDTQHDNGSFPGVAPFAQYGSEASEEIGWSDAGVIVPYNMWRQYGDTTIIEENWDAMERYLALVAANKFDSPHANRHQWADWLSFEDYESAGGGLGKRISAWETNPDGTKGPRKETIGYWHFLGGCYWLWDALMMKEMAAATGRTAAAGKYEKMADEAKAYIRKNFLDKDDGLVLRPYRANQTPSLFLLKFGLLESDKAVAATKAALLKNIADHKGCLTTGFLGTSILMDTLTYDAGVPETAYSLLLQHENPSWLYSVDQGATTVWERWNSYVKATGFGPVGMNSFNHYAYGAVLAWMYGTMAGIRADEKAPGFRHVILAPVPDRRIGHVEASYDSAYGRIKSAWRYGADGKWTWKFSIPANVTATVVVPGAAPAEYVSGDYTIVK